MINYIEFLKIPTKIAIILVVLFFILQIVGEILEFKGKVVPEFIKVRKYFARKKTERKSLAKIPFLIEHFEQSTSTLKEVKTLLDEVNQHYSNDNIAKRNKWMKWVDSKAIEYDHYGSCLTELEKKMDRIAATTLSLLVDNKRNAIIDFASKVIDSDFPVTREQFNRIFKIHEEYEEIIKRNGLTNGEVDIAYRIITESYENHMKNHTFVEDIRGYNNN